MKGRRANSSSCLGRAVVSAFAQRTADDSRIAAITHRSNAARPTERWLLSVGSAPAWIAGNSAIKAGSTAMQELEDVVG